MVFQDKVLVCRDCQDEFLFSAEEQAFYAEKGFAHDPTRCRACRAVRKGRSGPGPDRAASRGLHPAICTDCGRETEVPFRPSPGKPVYCRECFQRRGARPASRTAASPPEPRGRRVRPRG